MTALSITAANVSLVSGPVERDQVIGVAANAGALMYKRSSDGQWLRMRNAATAAEAGGDPLGKIGMLLSNADAAGARCSIALPGAVVSIGAGTAGIIYCVGATVALIVPSADLISGATCTIVALGIGGNQLMLTNVYNPLAVVP